MALDSRRSDGFPMAERVPTNEEIADLLDRVVIFFERDGLEDQSNVVTEHHGTLTGRRVVRGREPECVEHYGFH